MGIRLDRLIQTAKQDSKISKTEVEELISDVKKNGTFSAIEKATLNKLLSQSASLFELGAMSRLEAFIQGGPPPPLPADDLAPSAPTPFDAVDGVGPSGEVDELATPKEIASEFYRLLLERRDQVSMRDGLPGRLEFLDAEIKTLAEGRDRVFAYFICRANSGGWAYHSDSAQRRKSSAEMLKDLDMALQKSDADIAQEMGIDDYREMAKQLRNISLSQGFEWCNDSQVLGALDPQRPLMGQALEEAKAAAVAGAGLFRRYVLQVKANVDNKLVARSFVYGKQAEMDAEIEALTSLLNANSERYARAIHDLDAKAPAALNEMRLAAMASIGRLGGPGFLNESSRPANIQDIVSMEPSSRLNPPSPGTDGVPESSSDYDSVGVQNILNRLESKMTAAGDRGLTGLDEAELIGAAGRRSLEPSHLEAIRQIWNWSCRNNTPSAHTEAKAAIANILRGSGQPTHPLPTVYQGAAVTLSAGRADVLGRRDVGIIYNNGPGIQPSVVSMRDEIVKANDAVMFCEKLIASGNQFSNVSLADLHREHADAAAKLARLRAEYAAAGGRR